MQEVEIFCDGSGMTGKTPCGFAAILRYNGHEREVVGALPSGTNNVAELMAAIIGVEALTKPCVVSVTSDSEYLVFGIKQGRAVKWKSQGWRKKKYKDLARFARFGPEVCAAMAASEGWEKVPNWELWDRLLTALAPHQATFHWVRGHAGHPENSRCDRLAKQARINYLDHVLQL